MNYERSTNHIDKSEINTSANSNSYPLCNTTDEASIINQFPIFSQVVKRKKQKKKRRERERNGKMKPSEMDGK